MVNDNKTITIFIIPQQFPCGTDSSCCGPVGQTEEEIQQLKSALEKEIDCQVEVVDVTNGDEMKNHLEIVRLVRSLGPAALPIIVLDNEVVLMGNPNPQEVISAIQDRAGHCPADDATR